MSSSSMAGMRMAGREDARFHEPPVLVEARRTSRRRSCSTGVPRSPSSRFTSTAVALIRSRKILQESGILEDGYRPSIRFMAATCSRRPTSKRTAE